ncbi:hypothetical protein [Nocardia arthritidis]|uniref:Uncharacterized protein n=1 Tax=Nocardia arthritidis TaxID=228602 RepID=A0A6G9YB78_9NOCA|nr:hypothetical protein [Nocardia arthritidis]QIS10316.1 hypothetical protein F5544_12125 [Nocardia arthritidis]
MSLDSHRRPPESRDIGSSDISVLPADIAPLHEPGEFAEARAAERAESARQSAIAARTVASHAHNAADCMSLLAMLGLDAMAGKLAGGERI